VPEIMLGTAQQQQKQQQQNKQNKDGLPAWTFFSYRYIMRIF
jgi:hypothetical protein